MDVIYRGDLAFFNGFKFRRDKKSGYYLSTSKIGSRRERLHRYVWKIMTGQSIPGSCDIHHKDANKDNNTFGNLELIRRSEHQKLHGQMLTDTQREMRADNIKNNALPAAIKWHGSEDGRLWHSEHAKKQYQTKEPIWYICSFCAKPFSSKHNYGKDQKTFCSNKCKTFYRRKSGVDNVVRICCECGGEYEANKYSGAKYCKDCQNRKGYPRGRV